LGSGGNPSFLRFRLLNLHLWAVKDGRSGAMDRSLERGTPMRGGDLREKVVVVVLARYAVARIQLAQTGVSVLPVA
jgi:hypothetical protein